MRLTTITVVLLGIAASAGVARQASPPQFPPAAIPDVAAKGEGGPALYETPRIHTAPGLSATVVVPPGTMYDPLYVIPRPDGSVWINDDGGVAGKRGGYVWLVDSKGRVSPLVDASRMLPATGFDIAPRSFGKLGGQLLTLSTPSAQRIATRQNHIIESVPPRGRELSKTLCTLPDHGTVHEGLAAGGVEARFGPDGSPFANRFFSVLHWNNTIYQTTADGKCTPFATFDGAPFAVAFTNDGSRMLVAKKPTATGTPAPPGARAWIVSVAPDGTIDKTPVFDDAATSIHDIEVAPRNFPRYGGDIFYTQWGASSSPGTSTPPQWDGELYRVPKDGKAELIASGFSNPAGIAFSRNAIWVADLSRDGPFLDFKWVADGFAVRIDVLQTR